MIGRSVVCHPQVRFPARFLALVAGMYGLGALIEPLRSLVARLVVIGVPVATQAFGVTAETGADGAVSLAGGRFEYLVTYECASVSAIVVLVAAILAYPSSPGRPISLRQRLRGTALAVVGLTLLNFLRLGALAWVGVNAPDQFEAAHVYWFQGLTFLAVGVGWLGWVRSTRRAAHIPVARQTGDLPRFAVLFLTVFIPVAAVSALTGVDRIYAHVVGLLAAATAPLVWGHDVVTLDISAGQGALLYAGLVAILALFVATPAARPVAGLRAFALAAPVLAGAHVVALVAQTGAASGGAEAWGWGVMEGFLVLPMALVLAPLPVAIWFAWAEHDIRGRAPRRGTGRLRGADRVPANASAKG